METKNRTLPDFEKLARAARAKDRYSSQLARLRSQGIDPKHIDAAVKGAIKNLPKAKAGSLVVYGDPQSGKTEMMISLTARLLDDGYTTIVHLTNDSVDLLAQSLDRFRKAGLAPAPRNASDLGVSPLMKGQEAVLFCKKNAKDLAKLLSAIDIARPVIVVDDEADYATPNAKVNKQDKTRINELVSKLIGGDGKYIGVTATPARLNLNNTFDNRAETWVHFGAHAAYTGQDHFFPLTGEPPYRLVLLDGPGEAKDAQRAFARFLVTVAHLNLAAQRLHRPEKNYTFLVHTSGRMDDHLGDRQTIEAAMQAINAGKGKAFKAVAIEMFEQAKKLYPLEDPEELVSYVLANATRSAFIVLNSKRDRKTAGDNPTIPSCPFTVIIGGNIVSRGVTFPNLLAMYFTRNVKTKLQQDTYIQRARMFGARGEYLQHFELTIPKDLYADWHRCFVFHRLALDTIKNEKVSPVWLGDPRISIAASSSIDRSTVNMDRGEISFQLFDLPDPKILDLIISNNPGSISTLRKIQQEIGDAMPGFLIDYLDRSLKIAPGTLAIHRCRSISGYRDKFTDHASVARTKGFIGSPQLEKTRFPNAMHHVFVFYNANDKARVFYKQHAGIHFVQNLKK